MRFQSRCERGVTRHPEKGFEDLEQRLVDRHRRRAVQDQLVGVGVFVDHVGIVVGLLDDERMALGAHDAELDIVGKLDAQVPEEVDEALQSVTHPLGLFSLLLNLIDLMKGSLNEIMMVVNVVRNDIQSDATYLAARAA